MTVSSYVSKLQNARLRFKAPLAFGAGALCVLAMSPWNVPLALMAGLSFFYMMISGTHGRFAPFGISWLFAFGYFLFGLSWIGNALLVDGNDFQWAWPFEIAGLPALLAVFPAAGFAFATRFIKFEKFTGFLALAGLISLCEWARGHFFTGYPWNLFAYTWAGNLPVAQVSAYIGAYGLNFLTILWTSLPGWLLLTKEEPCRRKAVYAGAVLLTFIACFIGGALRLKAHPDTLRTDIVARLVQANIPQDEKWDEKKEADNLRKHLDLSWSQPVNDNVTTLVIWPETSLADFVTDVPAAKQSIINTLSYYKGPVYLVSGFLRHKEEKDGTAHYYNSLAIFDRGMNMLKAYDKSHLVPFGEYIPFQKYIPLKPFVEFAGFTPGKGPETYELPGVGKIGMSVCYEIIFPGAVVNRNEERPDWIINVTNDGWYGKSSGPHQHFDQTRFRAIEEGIPVVRAASTGISGVVGPTGRVIYQAGLMEKHGQNVALPIKLAQPTFYSRYNDLLFFFATFATLLLHFTCRKRRN